MNYDREAIKINKPIFCDVSSQNWFKEIPNRKYDLIAISNLFTEISDKGETESRAEDLFQQIFIEKYEQKKFLDIPPKKLGMNI